VKICNYLVKNMVSQTGPRVVRSNFCEYIRSDQPDRTHFVRVFIKNTHLCACIY